jgi:hypothetical protein
MSLGTTSLSDSLPPSIPKLDSTGLNWAIFSVRFQDAVEAKGFWGHFDGPEPRPVVSAATTTAEGEEATQTKLAEDLVAKQLQWERTSSQRNLCLPRRFPTRPLASLPFALSNFASAQLAAALMWAHTKTIDPDDLCVCFQAAARVKLEVRCSNRWRSGAQRRFWTALPFVFAFVLFRGVAAGDCSSVLDGLGVPGRSFEFTARV